MALLSQLPLLMFTLLNSFLYQRVKEHFRVTFSMVVIFILFSLTAGLVQVPMQPQTFFSVTMATIWFINMFGAVLQGSLFGVVGMFPPRYSTLFMSGQGLAGIFAAIAQLCSILREPDPSSAALGYFITPCVATLGILLCYLLLPHLEFAGFYLNRSQWSKAETSQDLISFSGEKVLSSGKVDLEAGGKVDLEAGGKVDLEAGGKVDLEAGGKVDLEAEESRERSSVLAVFRKIWLMALCVTCVFAVTLSVFPVITNRVKTIYTESPEWDKVFTCVCCYIIFNGMDLVGRGTPSLIQWPSRDSRTFPAAVFSRLIFIPLLMICNIQDSAITVVKHDFGFATIMALFAFSNGYLASLCMAYAPQLVQRKDCETAGSLMSFFLALGLVLGACLSFLLGKLV